MIYSHARKGMFIPISWDYVDVVLREWDLTMDSFYSR